MTPKPRLAVFLLIAAALLWNGWLIAIFVYPHQTWLHMEISELSIPTQPWSWLFRALDGLSALCMIGAGASLLLQFRHTLRGWITIGSVLLLAMGLLTLFDITHSLDCVQYNNSACLTSIAHHTTSWHDNAHQSESIVTSYTSIVFVMWLVAVCVRYKQKIVVTVATIILLVGIIWTLAILNETHDLLVYAINDRLWNLIFSGGLLILTYLALRRHLTFPPKS